MNSNENRLLSWEPEDTCSASSEKSSVVPSETSEDRDFIVSDTENLSDASAESTEGFNSYYCASCRCDGKCGVKGEKIAIKTIAKHSVSQDEHEVTRYLVLWYSWEDDEI
ncbi:hypothetical protein N7476_000363 [Penicillium atrosanguineum]|uniref:Uncharacterized protein n=1 Tax=Penicillium atrosanguineum TaxID=1132637 RepID=A0A9W9QBW8_9EURO|nr:hypothetical protein N7476_000363 [Penicillium atrosanguineum]